jgi:hypothetical protein
LDYAGNSQETAGQIYIDLTPPDIKSLKITIPEAPIFAGETYTTRETLISIIGNYTDEDIESIYIKPGSYNPTTGQLDAAANATLEPPEFEINMVVNGTPNTETLNNLVLYVTDRGGYETPLPLIVYVDLLPPEEPTVTFLPPLR